MMLERNQDNRWAEEDLLEGQGLACWWCWCGGAGSLATPRTVPWSLQLSLGPTGKPSGKLEPLSSSEQWLVTQIQEYSDNQKKTLFGFEDCAKCQGAAEGAGGPDGNWEGPHSGCTWALLQFWASSNGKSNGNDWSNTRKKY